MALDNLRNLYQQVILEHYKKPRHCGMTEHTLKAALEHQSVKSADDFVSNEEID